MRVLQLVQRPQRRGAEVAAHQLSAELRRRGHTVSVTYLYPHDGPGRLPLGPDDRTLGGDPGHPLERTLGFHPRLLSRLLRRLDAFAPDVVQANGARTIKYAALARRLRRSAGWVLVYRNIGDPSRWVRGPARRLFYRWLVMPAVDGVAAVSRTVLPELRRLVGGRPAVHVPQGVDPGALAATADRASVRRLLGTPPDAPVAVYVGSLTPEKRVDRLIRAVARARESRPDLELWVVGDGPLAEELRREAEAAGDGAAVRWPGARERVGDFLAAADVFVLASDTEGVPAAVLEAAWAGLPVVATRVGGVPEAVLDGETGRLVPPGDDEALAAALSELVARPRERRAMGERGRELVRSGFTLEAAADGFLELYERLRRGRGEGRTP